MIRKIGKIFANLPIAVAFLVLIAYVVLFVNGIKPYIVLSGSMEPNIHTGSVCFVDTNVKYEDILVNDVIAFETKTNALVTHRVINITSHGFETKGDNNNSSDGISTTQSNFRGQTLFSIPYLGYFSQFLQTKRGKIIIFTTFLFLIFFDILVSDGRHGCKNIKKNKIQVVYEDVDEFQ